MFSVAYVILQIGDIAPVDAIRASLAPFQSRGRRGASDNGFIFDDNTEELRQAYEAQFTFSDRGGGELAIEGDFEASGLLDHERVREEMRRRGRQIWHVRFADFIDLESFFTRFSIGVDRGLRSGTYGQWLNPLGRWDFWELGGVFDGHIIGQPSQRTRLGVSRISSGQSWDRMLLSKLAGSACKSFDQPVSAAFDDRSARNFESCATLLADALADREHAFPESLVLPPGSAADSLRWLDALPKPGPIEAFARLGLALDAKWDEVVEEIYMRFEDHWVAAIAYHH